MNTNPPAAPARTGPWQSSLAGVLALATALGVSAQPTPASSTAPDQPDEVVRLSVFEVTDTSTKGYITKETATGLKTGVPLSDLPMAVTVIPRAILEDIGENRLGYAEAVQFVSAGAVHHGDSDVVFMRGIRGPSALLDGSNEKGSYNDMVNIDSIDVLKGPSAVTYPITDITGVIIKNTKKPLPVSQQSVTLTVGSGNFQRAEVDSTGPLFKRDKLRITYRLTAAVQQSDGWMDTIDHNDRLIISPSVQLDAGNLTLRLASDYTKFNIISYAGTFLDNSRGRTTGPWAGAGKFATFRAPWEDDPYSDNRIRATALIRMSENWEMKLYGSYTAAYLHYHQSRFTSAPNFTTGTVPMFYFENDEYDIPYYGEIGVNGKYHLFGLDHVSTFGGYVEDRQTKSIRNQTPLPTQSIYAPNLAAVPDPILTPGILVPSGSPNNGYSTLLNAYYMHTASMLDDRIILVGGTSYVETRSRTYLRLTKTWDNPPDAHDTPYRIGAVVKPVRGISLFANNSTTFAFQGNRNQSGQLVGVRQGEVVEFGAKGDLFDGKVSFQLTRYDLKQTNLAVPDPTNVLFYVGSGQVLDKGWEFETQLQLTPNWSTLFSWYSGDVTNQPSNTRFTDSLAHSASGLTKYSFAKGTALEGFSVGLAWVHVGERWFPASSGGGFPGYDLFDSTISYERRNWKVSLNIKNLADKYYAMGGFDPLTWAWVGEPRAFYLSVRRSF